MSPAEGERRFANDSLRGRLFTAVTPTKVYPSLNVESYTYHRTSRQGLGLLIVDMELLEIREDQRAVVILFDQSLRKAGLGCGETQCLTKGMGSLMEMKMWRH